MKRKTLKFRRQGGAYYVIEGMKREKFATRSQARKYYRARLHAVAPRPASPEKG